VSLIEQSKYLVKIDQTGESYSCGTKESLLEGMIRLGKRGIPVGCVNGGCGVCKIHILDGEVAELGPVSRAHVSYEESAQGYTLACRVAPKTQISFEVVGKFEKPFTRLYAARQEEVNRSQDSKIPGFSKSRS